MLCIFKGVMSLSGVYNLHILSGGLLEYLFLRPAFGRNHGDWTTASPYHQLMQQKNSNKIASCEVAPNCIHCHDNDLLQCSCTFNVNQGKTPFLIMNAEKDPLLQQDAKTFVTMLKEKEYPCKHYVIRDTNHLSIVLSFGRIRGKGESVGEHCLAFIKEIESKIN
jgi:acetyl esterase/lipase